MAFLYYYYSTTFQSLGRSRRQWKGQGSRAETGGKETEDGGKANRREQEYRVDTRRRTSERARRERARIASERAIERASERAIELAIIYLSI